ncbi:MAG: GNAT family N-acetyltransferase [Firmicutes bacterium]|nr:GNAT family N-acetyltransferase [Bacillota bacterium]
MLFASGELSVRSLESGDEAVLVRWLSDPRLLRWYEGRDRPHDLQKVRTHYFLDAEERVQRCLVFWQERPVGFLQVYPISDGERMVYGYPEGITAYGMDQFIGEPDLWGCGIGTVLVASVVGWLTQTHGAELVVVDPRVENKRAIHVYERCGFRPIKVLPARELHEGAWHDCWLMEYRPTLMDAINPVAVREVLEVTAGVRDAIEVLDPPEDVREVLETAHQVQVVTTGASRFQDVDVDRVDVPERVARDVGELVEVDVSACAKGIGTPLDSLYVKVTDGIAEIVMNRPDKRNAMTLSMWRRLVEACAFVQQSPGVYMAIVRGVDGRAFCAGGDIAEFAVERANSLANRTYNAVVRQAVESLREIHKPTIAMISGACIGGGMEIAIACDLRFADEDATFGIPPARLGFVYDVIETKRLLDLVGPSRAKDILFSARRLTAVEALRFGLVTRVVRSQDLREYTLDYARLLSRRAQNSIRGSKAVIDALCAGTDVEDARLAQIVAESLDSVQYAEGIRAFRERREPRFSEW